MENRSIRYVTEPLEPVVELPREEALVRLYELLARYDGPTGVLCPTSLARAAQGLSDPHRFAFGCCRTPDASGDELVAGDGSA